MRAVGTGMGLQHGALAVHTTARHGEPTGGDGAENVYRHPDLRRA
jgi:hypothetical protein